MRKFVMLVVLAAACYFLCTHPALWKKYVPPGGKALFANNNLSGPFAWKTMAREDSKAPYSIAVEIMDGDRWRVEAKQEGSSKMLVAVSDGWKTMAKPRAIKGTALDPRPSVKALLAQLAMLKDSHSKIAERRDGHTCWRFDIKTDGITGQLWVDSTTLFPVCLLGSLNGKPTETHFSPVNADIAAHGDEYFDTGKTDPLFADELARGIDLSQGGAYAARAPEVSTPAAPQTRYFLKSPVTVRMAYGAVSVPARTEVRILGGAGTMRHVSGGGQEFDVQEDQLAKVSQ
jgi:hypothetical protein